LENNKAEDHHHVREVIAVAKRAQSRGNRPFSALLISAEGETLASREVLARAGRKVEVVGPVLEHEAESLFAPGG
jgi:hypothetical protein